MLQNIARDQPYSYRPYLYRIPQAYLDQAEEIQLMNLHYGADRKYGRRGAIATRMREDFRPVAPYLVAGLTGIGGPVAGAITGAVAKGAEMAGSAIASTAPSGSKPKGPDLKSWTDKDGRLCKEYIRYGRKESRCYNKLI